MIIVFTVMSAQSMTPSAASRNLLTNRMGKACLVGLLVAASLSARGVTYLSDHRSTSVSAHAPSGHASTPNNNATDTPSVDFIDRHLSASGSVNWQGMNGWTPAPTSGSAQQNATFTPNQIGINSLLFVSAGGDPYGVHYSPGASGSVTASSIFEIEFNVATTTQYNYLFDFDPTSTLTVANLSLSSENHGSQQLFRTSGAYVSGVLAPDTYTLQFVFASAAVGAQSGYNSGSAIFNFAPSPVPEPTAFALVGLGLIALGMLRRKRRN